MDTQLRLAERQSMLGATAANPIETWNDPVLEQAVESRILSFPWRLLEPLSKDTAIGSASGEIRYIFTFTGSSGGTVTYLSLGDPAILDIKEEGYGELNKLLVLGWQEQETLEEGEESEFSKRLLAFIIHYHRVAVEAISAKVDQGGLPPGLISDILSIIGEADDDHTRSQRLSLLVKYLRSNVPRIRHGAIMGIASMKNPEVIPEVKKALIVEDVRLLRSMLEQLVEYLRKIDT